MQQNNVVNTWNETKSWIYITWRKSDKIADLKLKKNTGKKEETFFIHLFILLFLYLIKKTEIIKTQQS